MSDRLKTPMEDRAGRVPTTQHHHLWALLEERPRKVLQHMVHVEATSSGRDRYFCQAVKPVAVGHLFESDTSGLKASSIGMNLLRILAVHRLVFDMGQSGWRLTPTGKLVAKCGAEPT